MQKYAKIKDEKIIKFVNVPDSDMVLITKLLTHNYRIVEKQKAPVYDYITQTLSDSYEIQKDKVLRVWKVAERSFEEAKRTKQDVVEQKALDDIKMGFEEGDQQAKVDKALVDKDAAIAKIEAAKSNTDLRAITEAKVVK